MDFKHSIIKGQHCITCKNIATKLTNPIPIKIRQYMYYLWEHSNQAD